MSEAASRPGAEGHRFGPDLSCSECGVTWEAHQANPQKCVDGSVDTQERQPRDGDVEAEFETPDTPERKRVGLAVAAPATLHVRAIRTD